MKNYIIIITFFFSNFLFSQPVPYIEDNLLKNLIGIHGVHWKSILAANNNDRSILRSKLKEVITATSQYYPDKSDAKLAYSNAVVGYGQFASRLSNDSTKLSDDVIDFYKSNLNLAFNNKDENQRQILYSSLRFTGSVDALEILQDALTRETSHSLRLDLLNYALDVVDDQNGLSIANNTLYNNLDTFNLTPDFLTRGSNDDWSKELDKFISGTDEVIKKLPQEVSQDAGFVTMLNGIKTKFEKAKERADSNKPKEVKQSDNFDKPDDNSNSNNRQAFNDSKVKKDIVRGPAKTKRGIASEEDETINDQKPKLWIWIFGFVALMFLISMFRKKSN